MNYNASINRRDFCMSAASVLAAASVSGCQAGTASFRNVLLLIGDDHGLDTPSYGNPSIQTPNLDRLAWDGVRFSNAFCTTASCSPSRSVILTGLHNHTNGQLGLAHGHHNFHTLPWVQTLPRLLKNRGYTTGVIGKLHVNPASLYPFDVCVTGEELGSIRSVATMSERARGFFEKNRDKPFFLLMGYGDPHRSAKGFGNEQPYPGVEETTYSPESMKPPAFLQDSAAVREELAEYSQAVSRLDLGIGMVLEALQASGKDKDTLVIYISDNGPPFPGAKTNLYDPGIHLPLIVRSPEQAKRGVVNQAMVSWTDLTPTILEWTGTPAPKEYELHGRSFLPILENENPSGWDSVFLSHTFHEVTMYYPMRGIRTRRYKYIQNLCPGLSFPHASDLYASKTWQELLARPEMRMGQRTVQDYLHRPSEELYDLEQDPWEFLNLAQGAEFQEILADLRGRTHEFRQRTNDPWLILENHAE
ncbi:MAG TPA: sulfatase [bacterium]|nr:sulfatase [bacterium]